MKILFVLRGNRGRSVVGQCKKHRHLFTPFFSKTFSITNCALSHNKFPNGLLGPPCPIPFGNGGHCRYLLKRRPGHHEAPPTFGHHVRLMVELGEFLEIWVNSESLRKFKLCSPCIWACVLCSHAEFVKRKASFKDNRSYE